MRALPLIIIAGLLAGCQPPGPPPPSPAEKKKAEQARLAEAQNRFRAFLDEATKGVELLQSHPSRDAIKAEIDKLQAVLSRASEVDPEHEKIVPLVQDGRDMMQFFNGCLKTANYQTAKLASKDKPKDFTPEKAQAFIDQACTENVKAIRQLIDQMKERIGP